MMERPTIAPMRRNAARVALTVAAISLCGPPPALCCGLVVRLESSFRRAALAVALLGCSSGHVPKSSGAGDAGASGTSGGANASGGGASTGGEGGTTGSAAGDGGGTATSGGGGSDAGSAGAVGGATGAASGAGGATGGAGGATGGTGGATGSTGGSTAGKGGADGGVPSACDASCGTTLTCVPGAGPACRDENWTNWSANAGGLSQNGDGTGTDSLSGLMWERSPIPTMFLVGDAAASCAALRTANYADWRLPTIVELVSIVRYDVTPPLGSLLGPATLYWSATPSATAPGQMWTIDFATGDSTTSAGLAARRCVR
jgi:hypothetical protein